MTPLTRTCTIKWLPRRKYHHCWLQTFPLRKVLPQSIIVEASGFYDILPQRHETTFTSAKRCMDYDTMLKSTHKEKTFDFADGDIITAGAKRFNFAEGLLQPNFVGKEGSGFCVTPFHNVMKCVVYFRKELYAHEFDNIRDFSHGDSSRLTICTIFNLGSMMFMSRNAQPISSRQRLGQVSVSSLVVCMIQVVTVCRPRQEMHFRLLWLQKC